MQITERIKLQIEEWRKRLIDLTRKNHLIYFNSSKKNILEVQQPELVTIFNKLFDGDNLNIFLPEEEKENNLVLQQEGFSKDIMNGNGKVPKDNEIVFTIKDRKELERRLRVIFRRAYSEYQEKGIWTSAFVFDNNKNKHNNSI